MKNTRTPPLIDDIDCERLHLFLRVQKNNVAHVIVSVGGILQITITRCSSSYQIVTFFRFIKARVVFPRMKRKFNESNFLSLIYSTKRINCTVQKTGKQIRTEKIQNRKKIYWFNYTLCIKNGAFPWAKLIYLKGKPKWTCEKTHMDPCSKCKTTMYGKYTSQNWWNVSNRQESNFIVPRQQSTKTICVNAILSRDYPRYGVFNECFLIVAILIKLKYSYIVNLHVTTTLSISWKLFIVKWFAARTFLANAKDNDTDERSIKK